MKQKKKIFFINEYCPPDYAATGQLVKDLASRLGSLNYKVTVLTSYPYYSNQNSNTIPKEKFKNLLIWRTKFTRIFKNFKSLNLLKSFLFALRVGIKLIIEAKEKDIIFFTTAPPFMPVVGYITSLITKTPYIVILFDLIPENLIDLKILRQSNPIIRVSLFLRNRSLNHSKNIINLNEHF